MFTPRSPRMHIVSEDFSAETCVMEKELGCDPIVSLGFARQTPPEEELIPGEGYYTRVVCHGLRGVTPEETEQLHKLGKGSMTQLCDLEMQSTPQIDVQLDVAESCMATCAPYSVGRNAAAGELERYELTGDMLPGVQVSIKCQGGSTGFFRGFRCGKVMTEPQVTVVSIEPR